MPCLGSQAATLCVLVIPKIMLFIYGFCSVLVLKPQPWVMLSAFGDVSALAKKTSDRVSMCDASPALTIRCFLPR